MKAGIFTQVGIAAVVDAPEPVLTADSVMVSVKAAGICGTDVHIFRGEYPDARFPLIPGHEFSGVVSAVGAEVTRFKVGDRVTVDPNVPCGRCYFCQRNEPNQCRNLRAIGVTQNGGFAQYVAAPEGNTFPIGDMPFDAAALIEPLACVVWGLKQIEVQPGDSVLVYGAGPMGCLLLQAVKHAGAGRVTVIDTVKSRLDMAERLGASECLLVDGQLSATLSALEPYGFDVVADATGVPKVIQDAIAYTKPRGKLWVFGVAPVGEKVEFMPYDIFRKDLKIVGSFAVNRTFPQSIALIQSKSIDVLPLISHRVPLDDFVKGFEFAQRDPSRMKVQYVID